eukprot:11163027-Lingulodinium_polyedra.AAC.1
MALLGPHPMAAHMVARRRRPTPCNLTRAKRLVEVCLFAYNATNASRGRGAGPLQSWFLPTPAPDASYD